MKSDGLYAEVAVPLAVNRVFSYLIPESLRERSLPGMRVLVPFGRKLEQGYLVGLSEQAPLAAEQMKPLFALLDEEPLLSAEILALTRWIADYYLAPWGMVIKAALPSGLSAATETFLTITPRGRTCAARLGETARPSGKTRLLALLAERGRLSLREIGRSIKIKSINSIIDELQAEGLIEAEVKLKQHKLARKEIPVVRLVEPVLEEVSLTDKQQALIEKLRGLGGACPLAELLKMAGAGRAVVKALAEKGILELGREATFRIPPPPLEYGELAPQRPHELTGEQQRALEAITSAMARRSYAPFLLHGVTGSGKTEIYIRAIGQALAEGGSALMLVPEIALTPQVSRLFYAAFGQQVAILHSALSAGERLDEWQRIKQGLARVVVGTRSAVFAPLSRLRLIIVDEEHDASYKQEETPRYNGREAALKRAEIAKAVVVLGSATPALETYYLAKERNQLNYLALESRILKRPLPEVHIVDMREEFQRFGRSALISEQLRQGIRARLARREQVLVLLNRRGYSRVVLCRSCGNTIYCEQCSVAMTFHRTDNRLLCHYCGSTAPVPERCPVCQGQHIYFIGVGTEQVQEALARLFPRARIERMDRDTTRQKRSYHKILGKFARGETDILIGTQMIAKGHDFPNVTLVGVVSADSGIALPDFRAAERTFQLLTQVAGRAGRGEIAGEVIIQTYYPNHYSLKYACWQDYLEFYKHEIRFRELLHYPPFVSLANILLQESDLAKLARIARRAAGELEAVREELAAREAVKILGPAPAPLEKIKGKYRYQILIKATDKELLRELIKRAAERLVRAKIGMGRLAIDFDPLTVM